MCCRLKFSSHQTVLTFPCALRTKDCPWILAKFLGPLSQVKADLGKWTCIKLRLLGISWRKLVSFSGIFHVHITCCPSYPVFFQNMTVLTDALLWMCPDVVVDVSSSSGFVSHDISVCRCFSVDSSFILVHFFANRTGFFLPHLNGYRRKLQNPVCKRHLSKSFWHSRAMRIYQRLRTM